MPFFRFKCPSCYSEKKKLTKHNVLSLECSCGGEMEKQLPRTMPPSITETMDKYRNSKNPVDQTERLQKRSKKYFVENEVQDLIAEHGVDAAKRYGWVKKDGKVITIDDL